MNRVLIGIIVALICSCSDVLLLYHPDLINQYDQYVFLYSINNGMNTVGWILGVIFLPLLYIGYHGAIGLADDNSRFVLKSNKWLVFIVIILGISVHSIYKFIPAFRGFDNPLTGTEILIIKIIEVAFTIVYLSFCLVILVRSFNKRNTLLYANRFFNPLFWIVVPIIVTMIDSSIGVYFIVSYFNCSIGFYFTGLVLNQKKIYR